jgi:lysophospholipase L1-like esterase
MPVKRDTMGTGPRRAYSVVAGSVAAPPTVHPAENAMPAQPGRRRFLVSAGTLGAAALTPLAPVRAAEPASAAAAAAAESWCATWGAAPAGPPPSATTLALANQTLRLIVHASVGGSRVRVRLSNEMGSTPLRIDGAHIGLRAGGASLVAGSGRNLSFGGQAGATIAAGAPLVSDPVNLTVPAQADLAISLYLANARATTTHDLALQTGYVSNSGNWLGATALPVARSIAAWPFLSGVDISGTGPALVAFGDSLTDGARSSANLNRRWPDYLARRLLQANRPVGIVNRGIAANSLLTTYSNALLAGRAGLERFERDALATSGLRWVVVLIGTNDILYSNGTNPVPLDRLTNGWLQLIARAHARGVRVYGATLPPFEGNSYFTAARNKVRQRANDWIRTPGNFDATIDFDAVLRDPARATRLKPALDSGDHLHPNDTGYQAMAAAVPLALLV